MIENEFSGYVLAGGKSSRMGADKAFLPARGKTFLENSVEILQPICRPVKVVLNRTQKDFVRRIPASASHVFDFYENRGALGGIHAALRDYSGECAVILAVDLPFVTGAAIEKLCRIMAREKDCEAVVPRQSDEKLQPLCAVYRVKNCLPKLEEILAKNDSVSVRHFLLTIKTKIVESKDLSQEKNLLANINSPEDFKMLADKN